MNPNIVPTTSIGLPVLVLLAVNRGRAHIALGRGSGPEVNLSSFVIDGADDSRFLLYSLRPLQFP